jgi:hypothetical protein
MDVMISSKNTALRLYIPYLQRSWSERSERCDTIPFGYLRKRKKKLIAGQVIDWLWLLKNIKQSIECTIFTLEHNCAFVY